jgi:hypothetical protein
VQVTASRNRKFATPIGVGMKATIQPRLLEDEEQKMHGVANTFVPKAVSFGAIVQSIK